jgi:hypothetical protein
VFLCVQFHHKSFFYDFLDSVASRMEEISHTEVSIAFCIHSDNTDFSRSFLL